MTLNCLFSNSFFYTLVFFKCFFKKKHIYIYIFYLAHHRPLQKEQLTSFKFVWYCFSIFCDLFSFINLTWFTISFFTIPFLVYNLSILFFFFSQDEKQLTWHWWVWLHSLWSQNYPVVKKSGKSRRKKLLS